MNALLLYLRTFNIWSVALRLVLSMICGGFIGLERGRKQRAAGLRTHMVVCVGAALAMLLGQYEIYAQEYFWSDISGMRGEVTRYGAQVINGIGFIGAGTVMVTGIHEIKGLTTAAGLWASACMGLAIGAGFYECFLLAFILIILSLRILPTIEFGMIERTRDMNVYLELHSLKDLGLITNHLKAQDAQILEIDIDRVPQNHRTSFGIVVSVLLPRRMLHTQVIATLMQLKCIQTINEI